MPTWYQDIFVVELYIFNSKFLIKHIINRCEDEKKKNIDDKWWLKLDKNGQKYLMKLAVGYTHSVSSELVPSYNLQIILDRENCEQGKKCKTSMLSLKKLLVLYF